MYHSRIIQGLQFLSIVTAITYHYSRFRIQALHIHTHARVRLHSLPSHITSGASHFRRKSRIPTHAKLHTANYTQRSTHGDLHTANTKPAQTRALSQHRSLNHTHGADDTQAVLSQALTLFLKGTNARGSPGSSCPPDWPADARLASRQ